MSSASNGLEFIAVWRAPFWRAKLTWPSSEIRYVGHFSSEIEANQWIEAHRWLQKLHTAPRRSRASRLKEKAAP
jgi:hypothetical protein